MNLPFQIKRFARWTIGVGRTFLRVNAPLTVVTVLTIFIRGLMQLFSMLLPIKVIFLAASPSVPNYLPFVSTELKQVWVAFMTLGSIGMYLFVQILNPIIDRWSLKAGKSLTRSANDMPINANDASEAQKAFFEFAKIYALTLFIVLSLVMLIWLNSKIVLWIITSLGALFLFASVVLTGDKVPLPNFKFIFIKQYRQFIVYWEIITFFGGFVIILLPFLRGNHGNVLLGLVSFIITRRLISDLSGVFRASVVLSARRAYIDALFYRSRPHFISKKNHSDHLINDLFITNERNKVFAKELGHIHNCSVAVCSEWKDPIPKQVLMFDLDVFSLGIDGEQQSTAQARVYSNTSKFQIENSRFLFKHVEKNLVHAPNEIAHFQYESFDVLIIAASGFRRPKVHEWESLRDLLFLAVLAVNPPASLVRSYKNSHLTTAERMTADFLPALRLVVQNQKEREFLCRWKIIQPQIVSRLRSHPVGIVNPDIKPVNVIWDKELESWVIMYWGRWYLDQLGSAIAHYGLSYTGASVVEEVQRKRGDGRKFKWDCDLEIGSLSQQFLQAIDGNRLRAALNLMIKIINLSEKND